MDLICLTIRDKNQYSWAKRHFYIPYSDRDLLPSNEWILDFIADPRPTLAWVDIFTDDETGEIVPIMRYEDDA